MPSLRGFAVLAVDTNVWLGLVDTSDDLHRSVIAELDGIGNEPLWTIEPVLTETTFALAPHQRARLQALLKKLGVRVVVLDDLAPVFAWLKKYADHEPDFADAYLAVLAGQHTRLRIWTHDREFHTHWKTPSGKRIACFPAEGDVLR